ncbi:hypothetical protein EON67_11310 [archaeon]|nr:MAG: hypothetical protein EON67_11310 [archaeon]
MPWRKCITLPRANKAKRARKHGSPQLEAACACQGAIFTSTTQQALAATRMRVLSCDGKAGEGEGEGEWWRHAHAPVSMFYSVLRERTDSIIARCAALCCMLSACTLRAGLNR